MRKHIAAVLFLIFLLASFSPVAASVGGTTGQAAALPSVPESIPSEPKTYLVGYTNEEAKQKASAEGFNPIQQFSVVPVSKVVLTPAEVSALRNNPGVAFVEEDLPVKAEAVQDSSWPNAVVGAPYLQSKGISGQGITIAILDTGIDPQHPDLSVAGGVSFLGSSWVDDNGHGTQVAGIVNGQLNGTGIDGISPKAEIYAVKVLDNTAAGRISSVIQGIEWAIANKINIILMSFGTPKESAALRAMTQIAYQKGVLLIASAGNQGNTGGDSITYPARYEAVIAVGAVNNNQQRSGFASVGPELELMAPGEGIITTNLGQSYKQVSGTSFSAAYVAGAAALVWSNHPTWSNDQLRYALDNSANSLGDRSQFGLGLVNGYRANLTPVPYVSKATGASGEPQLLVTNKDDEGLVKAQATNVSVSKYTITQGESSIISFYYDQFAHDTDVEVWYRGRTLVDSMTLINVKSGTYVFRTNSSTNPGYYIIRVVPLDAPTYSGEVVITVDPATTQPPEPPPPPRDTTSPVVIVKKQNPEVDSFYNNSFNPGNAEILEISVSDDTGVQRAELYVDSQYVKDVTGLRQTRWDAPLGVKSHYISVRAQDYAGNIGYGYVNLYALVTVAGSVVSYLPEDGVAWSPFHEDPIPSESPKKTVADYGDNFRMINALVVEGKSDGTRFIEAPRGLPKHRIGVSTYCDDVPEQATVRGTRQENYNLPGGGVGFRSYLETQLNPLVPNVWDIPDIVPDWANPSIQMVGRLGNNPHFPSIFSNLKAEIYPDGGVSVGVMDVPNSKDYGSSWFPYHYAYYDGYLVGGPSSHPPVDLNEWSKTTNTWFALMGRYVGSPFGIDQTYWFKALRGECARQRFVRINPDDYLYLQQHFPKETIPKLVKAKLLLLKQEIWPHLNPHEAVEGRPGPKVTRTADCVVPGCPGRENMKIYSFMSPVDVHVYDPAGRHTGPRGDGTLEEGIPDVLYMVFGHEKYLVVPNAPGYRIEFKGYDNGVVTINDHNFNGATKQSYRQYYLVPVTPQSRGTINLGNAMSEVRYDVNGAGNFATLTPTMATSNPASDDTDTAPPTTTASITGTAGASGYYRSPVEVRLSATDDLAGVDRTEYSLDGGATWIRYEKPFQLQEEKAYQLQYRSVDYNGNVEPAKTMQIVIDKTGPAVQAVPDRAPNSFGWYNKDVSVSFQASDALSGIATVSQPVTVSAEGANQVVTGSATDKAGNTSAASLPINLDKTNPTLQAVPDRAPNSNGWYNGDVTVTFQATDALSGITTVSQPVTMTIEGKGQVAQGSATDKAGNTSSTSLQFNIDKTPPTSTANLSPATPDGQNGWYISPVTLTLQATDALSGLERVEYQVNGGAWQPYAAPVTFTNEGVYKVLYRAVDAAGNVETARQATFQIDREPPVTTATPAGTAGQNGWYVSDVVVTMSAQDAASGVAKTEYSLDGGATWQPYAAPISITVEGKTTVTYRSTDYAGHVETAKALDILIDKTPPVSTGTLNPSAPNGQNDWYVTDVDATLTATDTVSGVARIEYSTDQGRTWNTYPSPLHFAAEGPQSLQFRAVDQAGNGEASHLVSFKIDKTKPVIMITGVDNNATYTDSVTPGVSATDAVSGVASQVITLNGAPWTPAPIQEKGAYRLQVVVRDVAGNETQSTVDFKVYWSTELTTSNANGVYSDPVTLTARLTAHGQPLANKTVTFRLNGRTVGQAATGADGIATLQYIVTEGAGTYPLAVDFAQDDQEFYRSSTAAGTLTVVQEKATVAFTGQTVFRAGGTVPLAATVTQENDGYPGNLGNLPVRFTVKSITADGSTVLAAVYEGQTDSQGRATVQTGLGVGVYQVSTTILNSPFYTAPPAPDQVVVVYDPNAGFVTGEGAWNNTDPSRGNLGKGRFEFEVKYRKDDHDDHDKDEHRSGVAYGELEVKLKGAKQKLKSRNIQWLVIRDQAAYFQGTGVMDGVGQVTFRVRAIATGKGRGSDVFSLEVWSGQNVNAAPVFSANNQTLTEGKIKIHKTKASDESHEREDRQPRDKK